MAHCRRACDTARMNTSFSGRGSRFGIWVVAPAVLVVAMLMAGCETLQSWTPSARKAEKAGVELQQLQARNMRFADDYVGRLLEAESVTRPLLTDPDQRMLISGWLLGQANAAYIAASGENPIIGALDLVTLASLSRMVVESWLVPRYPALTEPWLPAHRQLEAQAWDLVSTVLDPEQRETLRNLIIEWHKRNPDFRNVMFVRFQDFVGIMGGEASTVSSTREGGLFALIGLDPLAGLDPAVQQVELSRLLAGRAIYYAQRVPTLIDLQLDRSVSRIAATPVSKSLQEHTASLTLSVARFAGVAEAFPDVMAREREAWIRQLSVALTAQDASLRPALLDLRQTLEAGTDTATSVSEAARSIDALAASFAKEPNSAGATSGKPFDVNDYTRAAAEISRAASELRQLFGLIGMQSPKVDAALDTSVSKGQSLIDYFFVRVAWLITILCAGILAALLLYRWLAPRLGAPDQAGLRPTHN